MRTDVITIKASQLREGHTICFDNPRFDYVVEEVTDSCDGEVRVSSRNDTAVEFYDLRDVVWVLKD